MQTAFTPGALYWPKCRTAILTLLLLACQPFAVPVRADSTSLKKEIARLLIKRNLLALPSVSSQVSYTFKSKKSTKSSGFHTQAAAPPTLNTIGQSAIKNIFWRDINGVNVVDAIISNQPTPEACNEFISGERNGQSGGFGACHLAEGTGYAYSAIIESGTSLCYMRNFPTTKNLQAGGITVTAGALPKGGITRLFSPPAGNTPRLVKINVSGSPPRGEGEGQGGEGGPEMIFLQVFSQQENKTAGNFYKVNMWFCDAAGSAVQGYDRVTIFKNLRFSSEHGGNDSFGKNISTSGGFLVQNGSNLIWNPSRSRISSTLFSENNSDNIFKSSIEITPNKTIKVQRVDTFSGEMGKGFSISRYSGSNAKDLRFMAGAFKDVHRDNTMIKATEYQDGYYGIDTTSQYLDEVRAADLSSEFYTSNLEVTLDLSQYSCGATADVELSMNMDNETLRSSIGECVSERLNNQHYCHDDAEVRQADEIFRQACSQGPPPGP